MDFPWPQQSPRPSETCGSDGFPASRKLQYHLHYHFCAGNPNGIGGLVFCPSVKNGLKMIEAMSYEHEENESWTNTANMELWNLPKATSAWGCSLGAGCIFPSVCSWMAAPCLRADFPWKASWRCFPFTNRYPFSTSLSEELSRRKNVLSPTMQNICICSYCRREYPNHSRYIKLYLVSFRADCGIWHSESVVSLEKSSSISVTAGHSRLCRLLSIQLSLF